MSQLAFFLDPALIQEVVAPIAVTQKNDGSTGPLVFHLWLGNPEDGWAYQAASAPGVDDIQISVTDSNPGSNHESTEIKLAATQPELASAVAGDPLPIGLSLQSGIAGAYEFWVEINDATGVVQTVTELGLETNECNKTAV